MVRLLEIYGVNPTNLLFTPYCAIFVVVLPQKNMVCYKVAYHILNKQNKNNLKKIVKNNG
jgi:hypothetical protein